MVEQRFIEDEGVPGDAKMVGETWRYVNKKGGPDRRFSNNRQLPILLYLNMHLTSASGQNEMLEFSQLESPKTFAATLVELSK
jgi:hypothetical protein